MLLLALLSSVVGFALSQHHCCTPDVWEGEFHSTLGYTPTGHVDPKYAHVS